MADDIRQYKQSEQPEVRQESRATARQFPGDFAEEPAALRDVRPHQRGGEASFRNPGGVQECPATSGNDLKQFASLETLVVVNVSGQNECFAIRKVEVQAFDHLGARSARVAEVINGIREHCESGRVWAGMVVVAQEFILTGIGSRELSIDCEQLEVWREWQGEVAGVLNSSVTRQDEGFRFLDSAAANELSRPLRVVFPHLSRDGRDGRARRRSRSAPAKHPSEPVEAIVPVVVTRHSEEDTA